MMKQIIDANAEKYQQHAYLDYHDPTIEICRFLDADHKDHGAEHNREKTQQIEDAMCVRQCTRIDAKHMQLGANSLQVFPMTVVVDEFVPARARNCRRQLDAKIAQQANEVAAPA